MKEALKLALEALTNAIAVRNGEGGTKLVSPLEENAITAIKEALAPTSTQCEVQPEQEPCGGCGGSGWVPRDPDIGTDQECFDCNGSGAQPELVGWQYREANDDGTWGAWLGCDKRLAEDHWRQVRAVYTTSPKRRDEP